MSTNTEIRFRQYELFDANTQSRLITWLDASYKLKVGSRLTLKGIKTDWIVMKAYVTERSGSDMEFSRQWKVGGLP